MSHYWVNVGDGDTLKIQAEDMKGLNKCVRLAGFTPFMVNAVVKVGRESYLKTWTPWKKPEQVTP